jgi:hypothetical protein
MRWLRSGRSRFKASPGKYFERPPSPIKWTGGVAQAVERLLCKCEALSSNSSPTRKKKKRESSCDLTQPIRVLPCFFPLHVWLWSFLDVFWSILLPWFQLCGKPVWPQNTEESRKEILNPALSMLFKFYCVVLFWVFPWGEWSCL